MDHEYQTPGRCNAKRITELVERCHGLKNPDAQLAIEDLQIQDYSAQPLLG